MVRKWTRRLILTSSLAKSRKRVSVNVTSVVSSSHDWTTNKLSPSTSRTDRNGVQRLAGPLKSRSLIDKSMTNEINQWPSGYCGSLRSIRAAFSSSGGFILFDCVSRNLSDFSYDWRLFEIFHFRRKKKKNSDINKTMIYDRPIKMRIKKSYVNKV